MDFMIQIQFTVCIFPFYYKLIAKTDSNNTGLYHNIMMDQIINLVHFLLFELIRHMPNCIYNTFSTLCTKQPSNTCLFMFRKINYFNNIQCCFDIKSDWGHSGTVLTLLNLESQSLGRLMKLRVLYSVVNDNQRFEVIFWTDWRDRPTVFKNKN